MNQAQEHLLSPVDSLIGREPGWVIRAGTGFLALFLILVLLISAWVPYPRRVTARIVITSETPPVAVISAVDAPVAALFVHSGQSVSEGEPLAVLESDANYQRLRLLYTTLLESPLDVSRAGEYLSALHDFQGNRLGAVRAEFDALVSALDEYRFARTEDFAGERLAGLQRLSRDTRQQQQQLQLQIAVLNDSLALEEAQLQRIEILYQRGVIAATEVNRAQQRLLEKRLQRDETTLRLTTINSELRHQEQQQLALQEHYGETRNRQWQRIVVGREQLMAALERWHRAHWLVAPVAGEIVLNQVWTAHQFMRRGDTLLTIVPPESRLSARAYVAQKGAGQIHSGLPVTIELDSYPAVDYGWISGQVSAIDPVLREGSYQIHIELQQGLLTNQGEMLPAAANLEGQVQVHVQEKSLLATLLDQLLYRI